MNMRRLATCLGLCLLPLFANACEAPRHKPFPALGMAGGYVYFDQAPIEEGSSALGLTVNLLDCASGAAQRIGELPYLAEPGKVADAFWAEDAQGEFLVVMHAVPVNSYPGLIYSTDYYSILLYRRGSQGLALDERSSAYFGHGADVIGDDETLLFSYPYKHRNGVLKALQSPFYDNWLQGRLATLEVRAQKALIYSDASVASKTGMYLIAGDQVKVTGIAGGWVEMEYLTAKQKLIKGAMLCTDFNGC
ncbi:hypothetical protein KSS94_14455 [Pseudomonas fakonensis]|uniref:SH3 domain-containing protein n=1 Tax=Pseudomonas fakonensis TaxID=2842355 RepID=A0ABX8N1F0_9PSED|nr:hypothetical protein [Pseudomonas fakonensis]QXH49158.1 hypothetical protein KSS94_14455 [Pseudomonas fakonensis]